MSSAHEDMNAAPAEEVDEADEFLQRLQDLPRLIGGYLSDALDLLGTEGRLALRSLLMIAALTLCLAGLIAGSWLVLVVLAAYSALEAGVPGWGVALGVLLLHILAFLGLAQQLRALAHYLTFPHSRQAAARLLSRRPPPES